MSQHRKKSLRKSKIELKTIDDRLDPLSILGVQEFFQKKTSKKSAKKVQKKPIQKKEIDVIDLLESSSDSLDEIFGMGNMTGDGKILSSSSDDVVIVDSPKKNGKSERRVEENVKRKWTDVERGGEVGKVEKRVKLEKKVEKVEKVEKLEKSRRKSEDRSKWGDVSEKRFGGKDEKKDVQIKKSGGFSFSQIKQSLNNSSEFKKPKEIKLPTIDKKRKRRKSDKDRSKKKQKIHENEDSGIWCDKYRPQNMKDVSVHHKKLSEMVTSIEDALKGNYRVLILHGATGAGKSTALDVYCNNNDIEVCYWKNPSRYKKKTLLKKDQEYSEAALAPFLDFLNRERYTSVVDSGKNKLVVVDDFPYLHDFKQKEEFRSAIHFVLNSKKANPVVFILSDEYTGSSRINFIFQKDILENPLVKAIKFNPVANGMLKKVIKSISSQENLGLSNGQIDLLVENSSGDLRNAINTLQFNYFNKKGQEVMSSGRDIDLSIFHAMGKVLYNKRSTLSQEDSNLKGSTGRFRAPMATDPNIILKNLHLESQTFNQLLYANMPTFFVDIDEMANSLEYFSDSDMFSNFYWDRHLHEYSQNLCARGLMYSLKTRPSNQYNPFKAATYRKVVRQATNNSQLITKLTKILPDNIVKHNYTRHTYIRDILPFMGKKNLNISQNINSFIKDTTTYNRTPNYTSKAFKEDADLYDFEQDAKELQHYKTLQSNEKSYLEDDDIEEF